MELSSRRRSRSRGARNLSARVEREWFGDKARPWDETWATDIHRGALDSFKSMANAPEWHPQLFKRLPRNPRSGLYEEASTMEDKVKIIKNLLGLHQGEIRESYGFWEKKADPLPSQEAYAAYYSKQYARGEGMINAFLSHSGTSGTHLGRRSWWFSLMRLMESFGSDFTADHLYEFYCTMPIVVKKCPRSQRP